jgi:hypothetical protein
MTEPFVAAAKLSTLCLSLLVAYLAFHGYRRNGAVSMAYVSGGFVLIGVGAICEGLLYKTVGISITSAGLIQSVLVSGGMVLILGSLVRQERRRKPR